MTSKNIQIQLPILQEKGLELYVKREDLLHPYISGNKYRKLKYNIIQAKAMSTRCLVTFGGAYSNHILATAAAGKEYGFKTVGIIRGEELGEDLRKTLSQNPTLKQSFELGMEFKFVSRKEYQHKKEEEFIEKIIKEYPESYIIPEGGTNELAIKGCEEILTNEDREFSHIACAMGTGGTVTGIINSSNKNQQVLVFPALKGDWIKDEINNLQPNKQNWHIVSDYHFKGYGKVSDELVNFINQFKEDTDIPLDPIYTGKMMFGVLEMIKNNQFVKGSSVLAIHTGGLQGIQGINTQLKLKNKAIIL
ncbi:1-aminocyclopropane-1-carboxylate deaminase/D-cysteine desulfhydrase [Wenyingzhuangia sp. IMCC45533]